MNNLNLSSSLLAAAVAIAGLTMAGDASAQATNVQNAAGACQGALPVYATLLRNRPLAISNEGHSSSYVTCSPMTLDFYGTTNNFNGLVVANTTAADIDLSCTLVAGNIDFEPATYYPKTLTVPTGGAISVFFWDPVADNGGVNFANTSNYSCLLPPGIDIQAVFANPQP